MRQYSTVKTISAELGIAPETVRKWVREMRKESRYDPETTFYGDSRTILVRTVCLLDYSKHRTELQNPVLRKYIPEFDALAIEKKIGVLRNEVCGD